MIRRTNPTLTVETGATFSDCLAYRYLLWRRFDDGPLMNFLMLNPSTADDLDNDPTVARCQRRAELLGYGGLVVTNLFALRSTDPMALRRHDAPIQAAGTMDNDDAIRDAAKHSAMVVCAWGNHGTHRGRSAAVLKALRELCPDKLHLLKACENGEPGHPLYLPYDLKPVRMEALA